MIGLQMCCRCAAAPAGEDQREQPNPAEEETGTRGALEWKQRGKGEREIPHNYHLAGIIRSPSEAPLSCTDHRSIEGVVVPVETGSYHGNKSRGCGLGWRRQPS